MVCIVDTIVGIFLFTVELLVPPLGIHVLGHPDLLIILETVDALETELSSLRIVIDNFGSLYSRRFLSSMLGLCTPYSGR